MCRRQILYEQVKSSVWTPIKMFQGLLSCFLFLFLAFFLSFLSFFFLYIRRTKSAHPPTPAPSTPYEHSSPARLARKSAP